MTRTKKLTRMLLALLLLAGITIAVSADGATDISATYVYDGEVYNCSGSLAVYNTFTANAYTGVDTIHGHYSYLESAVAVWDANGNSLGTDYDYDGTGNLFVYASLNGNAEPASAIGEHLVYIYDYEITVEENTGIANPSTVPYDICYFTGRTTWEP